MTIIQYEGTNVVGSILGTSSFSAIRFLDECRLTGRRALSLEAAAVSSSTLTIVALIFTDGLILE